MKDHQRVAVKAVMVGSMKLPERVRRILAEDEKAERRFRLKGGTVYTTDRRFLDHSWRGVIGHNYTDISDISRTTRRFRWLLIPGVAVAVAGGVAGYYGVGQSLVAQSVGLVAAGVSLALGLILSVVGVMARSERLEIRLVDASSPVVYKGSAGRLLSLMQSIRQKRVARPPVAEESFEEDDVTAFADTLVLLADLKDKGGISREGFERFKQEIRRCSVPVGSGVAGNTDVGWQASARRGAAAVSDNSPGEHDEALQPVKCEILTALARDSSHGAFDGAGSLVEAATRAGASTEEIAEALGVTQFTGAIGSLYRSSTALQGLAVATVSSTV